MNIGNITSNNFNLDGNGKDMQIEVYEQLIEQLQQENKKLKEQLLVAHANEETFRLEMEDITKALGLDKDTLFDDVKVYARSLKDIRNYLIMKINIVYLLGKLLHFVQGKEVDIKHY